MSPSPLEFLQHILDELNYLQRERELLTEAAFIKNPTYQRAFARSLEVIGEAAKKVNPSFREEHPEVPWASMAKLRDKLIHHYFGVDYELVWQIIDTEVPSLHSKITRMLENQPPSES
jgi:uncharacterized protein with HEPN domain